MSQDTSFHDIKQNCIAEVRSYMNPDNTFAKLHRNIGIWWETGVQRAAAFLIEMEKAKTKEDFSNIVCADKYKEGKDLIEILKKYIFEAYQVTDIELTTIAKENPIYVTFSNSASIPVLSPPKILDEVNTQENAKKIMFAHILQNHKKYTPAKKDNTEKVADEIELTSFHNRFN